MSKYVISELFLYRWRYWFGYSIVAIGLIAILIFAGLYAPGGISAAEMQSVIKSSSINYSDFGSLAITNLPYHMLQQLSLVIFGVSILSIKLPSIILAFFSAIGLVLLLRLWFKPRIAVLASLIAITTGQFIFIAQDGTQGVLYLFWSVMLILLASLISNKKKFRMLYKVSFFIFSALSLYTPLSIYMLIALATAIILHPHLRFMIRQLSKPKIIFAMTISAILAVPLVITVIKTPNLGLRLLGIPTQMPDFGANFASLGAEYLGFAKPGGTTLMTPFFELGSMLIIAAGVYYVIKTRETAKSYVIGLWTLCLIPIIFLNPGFASATFLPLVILLASGLNLLLAKWYGLFPRNPYARIGGLIPVVILVAVLVTSGLDRYADGYRFDPNIAPNFSTDLKLIPQDTKNLVVTINELDFYKVVAAHNKQLNVSVAPTGYTFLVSHEANKTFEGYKVKQIIVSHGTNQSDRFYLYTKI